MTMNNSPRQRYALIFTLTILGAFVYVMFMSMAGGADTFEDGFYQRSTLISLFNSLKYSLGNHVFPQVLVAEDGYLEFTSDGNLDDYQNARLLPGRLKDIYQQLKTLDGYLKAKDIELVVVVAPNKATIYPEKVPAEVKKVAEASRLDFFMDQAREADAPTIIDLRPSLLQARQERQIYYKTDTHWNSYGAYIAYRDIMNSIAAAYPELSPYPLDDFTIKESEPQKMDLARLLTVDSITEPRMSAVKTGVEDVYLYRFPAPSTVSMSWAESGQGRKALVYHDSFGELLNTFFQYNFDEVVYVRNGGYACPSTGAWIDTFDPDVVIIEVVERDLVYLDKLLSNLMCEGK